MGSETQSSSLIFFIRLDWLMVLRCNPANNYMVAVLQCQKVNPLGLVRYTWVSSKKLQFSALYNSMYFNKELFDEQYALRMSERYREISKNILRLQAILIIIAALVFFHYVRDSVNVNIYGFEIKNAEGLIPYLLIGYSFLSAFVSFMMLQKEYYREAIKVFILINLRKTTIDENITKKMSLQF